MRQIRSFAIAGDPVTACTRPWPIYAGGDRVGQISSATWSPDFETNVAIGMIRMTHWKDGTTVEVEAPDGTRSAQVREASFI